MNHLGMVKIIYLFSLLYNFQYVCSNTDPLWCNKGQLFLYYVSGSTSSRCLLCPLWHIFVVIPSQTQGRCSKASAFNEEGCKQRAKSQRSLEMNHSSLLYWWEVQDELKKQKNKTKKELTDQGYCNSCNRKTKSTAMNRSVSRELLILSQGSLPGTPPPLPPPRAQWGGILSAWSHEAIWWRGTSGKCWGAEG